MVQFPLFNLIQPKMTKKDQWKLVSADLKLTFSYRNAAINIEITPTTHWGILIEDSIS